MRRRWLSPLKVCSLTKPQVRIQGSGEQRREKMNETPQTLCLPTTMSRHSKDLREEGPLLHCLSNVTRIFSGSLSLRSTQIHSVSRNLEVLVKHCIETQHRWRIGEWEGQIIDQKYSLSIFLLKGGK